MLKLDKRSRRVNGGKHLLTVRAQVYLITIDPRTRNNNSNRNETYAHVVRSVKVVHWVTVHLALRRNLTADTAPA